MANYPVSYFEEVLKDDLPTIPANIQNRIERAISERLTSYPEKYGERLRKGLTGLWKLRVGDYRIIYEIEGQVVRIWMIAHRKEVYEEIQKRWVKHSS